MALVGSPVGKPWGRRLPVSVGGIVGKTYVDFQSQIATLATGGAVSRTSIIGITGGKYRCTLATTSNGVMTGSTWNDYADANTSSYGRAIQHGLPSSAVWTQITTDGQEVYLETTPVGGRGTFNAVTRNGYTSSSSATASDATTITLLIRWDPSVNKAFQSNPSVAGAETEYVW